MIPSCGLLRYLSGIWSDECQTAWVGFYQLITPLPTKMLCCSSFSLFNRSGLFFFALSAIVEVLSLLLSDSRHKICSCSCSKIISLRPPPLLIVCTLGNRLFTTLGTRCWLFIFALCSFVLRVIWWWGLFDWFVTTHFDVSQVISATVGNRCVSCWSNIAEEIDMAA